MTWLLVPMQCWTYIRVSVHGVPYRYSGKRSECVVAVGDTFLFAPLNRDGDLDLAAATARGLCIPTLSDSVCLTHPLPYYQVFVGPGLEEKAAARIVSCARSLH